MAEPKIFPTFPCRKPRLLTLWLCTIGIPLMNLATVCVVFHVSVSINDCTFTPGHGKVRFLPATATIVFTGMFSSSDERQIRGLGGGRREGKVSLLLLWHMKWFSRLILHPLGLRVHGRRRVEEEEQITGRCVHKNHRGPYAAARFSVIVAFTATRIFRL